MDYTTDSVHISTISVGDTIEHNGKFVTVCSNDIKNTTNGITIFGDSYRLGTKPVYKLSIIHTRGLPA